MFSLGKSKSKFPQYEVINRDYCTPVRPHRMDLLTNNSGWKCQKEIAVFFHSVWNWLLIQLLWSQTLPHMSKWLPVCPRTCLPGDRSQEHNMSRQEFSVVAAGVTTAATTTLRCWKSTQRPEIKDLVNYMTTNSSCGFMLTRTTDRDHAKRKVQGNFGIILRCRKTLKCDACSLMLCLFFIYLFSNY